MTAATPFERLLSADAQLTDALVNKLDEQTLAALLVARFQSLVARGSASPRHSSAAVRTGEPEARRRAAPAAAAPVAERRLVPHDGPERRCIRQHRRDHSICQQSHGVRYRQVRSIS